MENNRYNNSKIYKLVDQVNGYFYIGSTCNPLSKRLYWHKCSAKKHSERKVYKYFNELGWDNVKIILIEEHYLDNNEELIREEDRVIQMYLHEDKCLNSYRAFVTQEEARENHNKQQKLYYEENKERVQAYKKDYYEANKNDISDKCKEYRENNKESISEYKKDYYQSNKEIIQQYKKEYYIKNWDALQSHKKEYRELHKDEIHEQHGKKETCLCGTIFTHSNKARHNRSKKHQAWIHDQQQTGETI